MIPAWPDPPSDIPLGDGRTAHARERPESIEALCAAVERGRAAGLGVYPQGGRTCLDYGNPPARPGIALDLTALENVIDYPAADMTITVQAGITLAALQTVLAREHQRLAIDPPQADRATLGGIFATNASGPRRYAWGRPRDQILGVSFVSGAGVVVKGGGRVVKNVAGYDLPKLMTGSLGTLGVLTQLTLKVRPLPQCTALAWCAGLDPNTAAAALDRLNTSAARPVAIELLNAPAAARLGAPLGLPTPAAGLTLVVGLEGNPAAVAWELHQVQREAAAPVVQEVTEPDATTLWSGLVEAAAETAGPIRCVANIRPSAVTAFLTRLDPARWAVQAHAGNGIVRAQAREDLAQEEFAAELEPLRAEALRLGGNLVLEHCPTSWKSKLGVWGSPRGDWVIMERIKQALDPDNLFNPGRFVGPA